MESYAEDNNYSKFHQILLSLDFLHAMDSKNGIVIKKHSNNNSVLYALTKKGGLDCCSLGLCQHRI
jgi:hypothetical protein